MSAKKLLQTTPDRLIDLAYGQLRRDVVRCVIAPGSEVSEAQLALRYGFGKAAVRAALMRISQEGLAVALPRRGYQIAPITIRDVREIFQLRALLEPEAVRLAVPHVDVARLRELDAVCAKGYTPGNRASEEAFLQANREFHTHMIAACGNERLARLLSDIIDQMERLFHLGIARAIRRDQLREQHVGLIKAVASRDAEQASQIVADHVETMRQTVVDGVMNSVDVTLPPLSLRP